MRSYVYVSVKKFTVKLSYLITKKKKKKRRKSLPILAQWRIEIPSHAMIDRKDLI